MNKKWWLVLAILLTAAIWINNKFKEHGISLGKLTRPPKLRIVYSKKIKPEDRPKISNSFDAVKVFRSIWSNQIEVREEMILLLLDRSNRVLGYHLLSQGGITGTVADIRLVFGVALESLASSIIMAHNHPSGNIQPSEADKQLTRSIKDGGKMMDIELLDHIILTKHEHFSFSDEGLM